MEGHFEYGLRVPRDGGIHAGGGGGGACHLGLVTHFAANGWPCGKFHSQLAAHYPRNCEKPAKGINWRFNLRIADVKFHKENESLHHTEIRNSWYNTAPNGCLTRAARLEILHVDLDQITDSSGLIWTSMIRLGPTNHRRPVLNLDSRRWGERKRKKIYIYIFTGGAGGERCKREREREKKKFY